MYLALFFALLIPVVLAVLVGAAVIIAINVRLWWIPIIAIFVVVILFVIFSHWYYIFLAIFIGLLTYVAMITRSLLLRIGMAILVLAAVGACMILNVSPVHLTLKTPAKPAETTPVATCATNLNFRGGGQVTDDLSDGDSSMGTIIKVTRDNPSTDPILIVVMPKSSVDVAYKGNMYFTDDRFSGNTTEAICLAEKLYPGVPNKIIVGSDTIPSGWQHFGDTDGWWTISTWLYKTEAIQPTGLTASKGFFISKTQADRTIKTNDGQVVYGQFWKTDGVVVHIQIRANQPPVKIPVGYQGTYWIWSGDFTKGEVELQKRMVQATFQEVAPRDDIKKVVLYIFGTMPTGIDPTITQFNFKGENVTWQTGPQSDAAWDPAQ